MLVIMPIDVVLYLIIYFPAPFGPINPKIWFFFTSNVNPFTAWNSLKLYLLKFKPLYYFLIFIIYIDY